MSEDPEDEAEAWANARRAWDAMRYLFGHLDVLEEAVDEHARYQPEGEELETYYRQYAARERLEAFMREAIQKLGTQVGHPPEEIYESDWEDWFGYDREEIEEWFETEEESQLAFPKVRG